MSCIIELEQCVDQSGVPTYGDSYPSVIALAELGHSRCCVDPTVL